MEMAEEEELAVEREDEGEALNEDDDLAEGKGKQLDGGGARRKIVVMVTEVAHLVMVLYLSH